MSAKVSAVRCSSCGSVSDIFTRSRASSASASSLLPWTTKSLRFPWRKITTRQRSLLFRYTGMDTLHDLTQERLERSPRDSPAPPEPHRAGHAPFATELLGGLLGQLERGRDLLDGHREGAASVSDKDRAALDEGQRCTGRGESQVCRRLRAPLATHAVSDDLGSVDGGSESGVVRPHGDEPLRLTSWAA